MRRYSYNIAVGASEEVRSKADALVLLSVSSSSSSVLEPLALVGQL